MICETEATVSNLRLDPGFCMICLQGQDPLQDQIRMYVAPNSSVWDQNRSHGCCSGVCFSNGNGKEDGELVHIVAIALEIVK